MRAIAFIFATRALRNVAYGWLTVAFALILEARGYSAQTIGLILTLALGAGAVYVASTGRWVRRFDRRITLIVAALLMAVSGALIAAGSDGLTFVAVLLGTIGAGTQEVGPFSSLEQTLIADVAGTRAPAYFGHYNLIGAIAIALGAAIPTAIVPVAAPFGYSAIALLMALLYALMPHVPVPEPSLEKPLAAHVPRAVERLAFLFAVDAFGGGIIVQSFMVYWFAIRFHADAQVLGMLFFAVNIVAAVSLLFAAPLARRIGPVRTMVYTHLPSNLLLIAIPLMPTFEIAGAVLLVRFALSQIDVPVRQALVMAIVPPAERAHAAGLLHSRAARKPIGPRAPRRVRPGRQQPP